MSAQELVAGACGADVPVHYLPCSFDTSTSKKANVSGYFTPTIRDSDAAGLATGEKGSCHKWPVQ